jgi:hypothetical protein
MIRPRLLRASLLLTPLLFAACTDEGPLVSPDAAAPEAGAPDAGADGSAVDGSAADAGTDSGTAGTAAVGLAVVHSDYKTTLVSLVDPATGSLTKDDCINSGSKPAMLTTALSGDVVVPSQPQPGNDLLLIDRQNSTLTWVAPKTCEVTRQVNIGEGKMANPQDVLPVSAKKAYISRYAAGDLAILDPTTGTIGGHIDLAPSAPKVGDMAVLPDPSRGVVVNGKAYVVLTALSVDNKVGAPGRVVVVDTTSDTVTGTIDLPGIKNCGSVAVAGSALVVACGGLYGDANQVNDSGVAWIDLSMTPPAVKVVAAKDFGRALSPFDAAALSSSLAFAITGGAFGDMPPDQLWAFDFAGGGAPRKLLDGKASFTLSGLVADDAHKKLFIADGDAKAPKLHIFDLANPAAISEQAALITNAGGLPPRYVSWY